MNIEVPIVVTSAAEKEGIESIKQITLEFINQ
jgi:hypothetical protein